MTLGVVSAFVGATMQWAGVPDTGVLGADYLTQAVYEPVSGWLYCNGAAIPRAQFPDLLNSFTRNGAVAPAYGAGNGTTTFNLPDLRERVPVPPSTNFRTVGATGGEINHTLGTNEMPVHGHSGNTGIGGGHTHATAIGNLHQTNSVVGYTPGGQSLLLPQDIGAGVTVAAANGDHIHGFTTANAGSSSPHNNMQPYVVVGGWLVKY